MDIDKKEVIYEIKKKIGAGVYTRLPYGIKKLYIESHMAMKEGYGYSYGRYKSEKSKAKRGK